MLKGDLNDFEGLRDLPEDPEDIRMEGFVEGLYHSELPDHDWCSLHDEEMEKVL